MSNFMEKRQFYADKIKFYYDEVEQIYQYLNGVHKLLLLIYQTESDSPARKARIDFFSRLRQERELEGLVALQNVIEYQSLLLDLYENNFIIGKKYYFF